MFDIFVWTIKPYNTYNIKFEHASAIGAVLATEGSTDPVCTHSYFYDPHFQAKHKALQSSTRAIKQRELAQRVDIFRLLRDILVHDCNNTYLQSFFSVNEYIQRNSLSPEN